MPTSLKLSDVEIQLLKEVRDNLVRNGLKRVESIQVRCTKCSSLIENTIVTDAKWICKRCGHAQSGIPLGAGGSFALGAVAGVSALALLSWMNNQPASEAQASQLSSGKPRWEAPGVHST